MMKLIEDAKNRLIYLLINNKVETETLKGETDEFLVFNYKDEDDEYFTTIENYQYDLEKNENIKSVTWSLGFFLIEITYEQYDKVDNTLDIIVNIPDGKSIHNLLPLLLNQDNYSDILIDTRVRLIQLLEKGKVDENGDNWYDFLVLNASNNPNEYYTNIKPYIHEGNFSERSFNFHTFNITLIYNKSNNNLDILIGIPEDKTIYDLLPLLLQHRFLL